MKKFIAILLTLIFVLSVFTACAAKPAETPAEQPAASNGNDAPAAESDGQKGFDGMTLTIAQTNIDPSTGEAIRAEFDAFSEKYGCTIELEILSANADEAENVMLTRAATGNLPDVFLRTIGAKMEELDPKTNMYDISSQSWVRKNVNAGFLDIVTDDETGAIYGVPVYTSNVAGVFYNKPAYEELGLEIPTTWDEFLANCAVIRETSDKDPVVGAYNNAAGCQILYLSQYYYVQNNTPTFADDYTERKTTLAENADFMRGLEKLNDLSEMGYLNSDPLATSFEDSAIMLAEGRAVHTFCRTNIMATIESSAPDKMEDIGFFPPPDTDSNVRGVAMWMPSAWCINKNIDESKLELALKLLEFLTTSEATDAYTSVISPTGAFMLNGIEMPSNVSTAVQEAQAWAEKASTPVMEYFCDIKGSNLATILSMVGTSQYTPEEGISEIEADNAIDAQQKGVAGW